MNYFQPITHYYIIDIIDHRNIFLKFNDTYFCNYVNTTFPILKILNDKKRNAIALGDGDNYKKYVYLTQFAIKYLQIPHHIMAINHQNSGPLEPATGIMINSVTPKYPEIEERRVTDEELGNYYISDYEELVKNFFNPSEEIKIKANISVEELNHQYTLNVIRKRIKVKEKLLGTKERKN